MVISNYIIAALIVLVGFISDQTSIRQDVLLQTIVNQEDPIEWIGQIPLPPEKINKSLSRKIGELIFGSDIGLFSKPVAVFPSDQEGYWVLSQGNGKVFKYIDGKETTPAGIRRKNMLFGSLTSICTDGKGGFIFSDSGYDQLFHVLNDGNTIEPFGTTLKFSRPTGIAYNRKTDQFWVINTGTHDVKILDNNGILVKCIGKRGTEKREFNFPTHIWIDGEGRVYINDSMNFRVQILTETGEFITSFGSAGNTTGSFARPKGIATDSFGNIYVADALFHTVQVFNEKGQLLYYFGSQGRAEGQFWMPSGLFIDENDNILVADSYNNRVQIFKLNLK